MAGRTYTDEEVEAILRRALERQPSGQRLEHEDLIAAAREVGLDEAAIARAIDEIGTERSIASVRAALRARRRAGWLRHALAYAAVVGGLLGLHALGVAGTWVFWVAFGWGVALALDTYGRLRAPTDEELERERRKLDRHERRRTEAEARREARRRQRREKEERRRRRAETGEQIEQAIEEGAALLLTAAAKKLRAHLAPEAPASTEFGRYVERRKAEAAGTPREPARVRVEPEAPEEEHPIEPDPAGSRRKRKRR